jgi:AraC-like DNA-binding protein
VDHSEIYFVFVPQLLSSAPGPQMERAMEKGAADFGIQFSTDAVPARERLSYFREALGRSFTRLDLGPCDDRPLHYKATAHGFDGLGVIWGRTNGHIGRRTQSLLTDGNDDFILGTILSGCSLPSQVGREFRMDAGSAVLLSCGDVGAKDYPVPTEFLTLRIPRRLLNGMAAKPEDELARPIAANTEALRLLVDYVQTTLKNRQLQSPELRRLFAGHICDLVALVVGATRDAANIAYSRGIRAARLQAAKAFITRNIRRADLSAKTVAIHLGVTPRYVHLLFETENLSFNKFVIKRRLVRAYEMVFDSQRSDRTITAIAFAAGFSDLSHFYREFRRRYGMTPSEARYAGRVAGDA